MTLREIYCILIGLGCHLVIFAMHVFFLHTIFGQWTVYQRMLHGSRFGCVKQQGLVNLMVS